MAPVSRIAASPPAAILFACTTVPGDPATITVTSAPPAKSLASTMLPLDPSTRMAWPPLTGTTLPSSQLPFEPSSTTKPSLDPAPDRELPTITLLSEPLVTLTPTSEDSVTTFWATWLPDAFSSWIAAHSFFARLRLVTAFRTVPACSTTPKSKLMTEPLRIVTSAWPLLRTPVPRPTPWITWPFRFTSMPGAPITRPSPAHPTRLLVTVVLARSTSPHVIVSARAAGAATAQHGERRQHEREEAAPVAASPAFDSGCP